MALGDGIRRNVAKVSQEERDRLRDAFIALSNDPSFRYPDGVSYWDKQEDIHKDAHQGGQDVHAGPAFLPWHRELCNRLEALLREVDADLSLHYWDWTTDPRASDNGSGGTTNLFTSAFMGSSSGNAGPPLADFESSEDAELGDGHTKIWRDVNPGSPPISSDASIYENGNTAPQVNQFLQMNTALQGAHNTAHGYIGGTIGHPHYSFHDPFVFLLHSNVDRLWARGQTAQGRAWRLDPNKTYGTAGTAASIVSDLEPWAGATGLRPWGPPDNQQVAKNSKHPSVVAPPRYDTNVVPRPPAGGDGGPAATSRGLHPLDVFVRGRHNHELVHRFWNGQRWSGWINLGGDLASGPAVTSGGPHPLDVFVRGEHNHELVHRVWGGNSWSGWINLGGDLASKPAVTSRGPHPLDVFVEGEHNHELVHRFWDGHRWSGWINLGGDLAGAPAVTSGGPHQLDVFVRGKHNHELVHRFWDGDSWSGWINLGGDLASGPAVTSGGPHPLDVFVRGEHNHELVHRFWDGDSWSGWINLGGDLAAGPAVTSRGPHPMDVFVEGEHNHELVHRFWDGHQWSGWINLGGDLA
jgi:hypothetical protein